MAYAMKILLPLLYTISAAVFWTESEGAALLFDATEFYNKSITRIFKTVDHQNVNTLASSIENHNATNFEIPVDLEIGSFKNKFFFTSINISVKYLGSPRMQYDFSKREIVIFNPEFSIEVETYVGASKNVAHAGFILSMHFENISIIATMPAHLSPRDKFKIDISYDGLMFDFVYLPWFRSDLSLELQNELKNKTKLTLPSVLTYNLNHNENFLEQINRTYCVLMAGSELQLRDPHFRERELSYYYKVRDASSFRIALSNIVVNGLTNFESLKCENTSSFEELVYTLTIKNVRGIACLRYMVNPLREYVFNLKFSVESLSILFNQETGRVHVEAHRHSVNKPNATLTRRQMDWILEGVSRAIASSIMPSMEVCQNRNELSGTLDNIHPMIKLFGEISDQFHWTRMNKPYENLTSFEPNRTITTIEIALNPDPSNTTVSVRHLKLVNSITPYRYPFQMECHFFDKLVLLYDIDGTARGTVRLNSSTKNPIDVNFTAVFTYSDQITKHTQDRYEFKVWLSYLIKPIMITLSPTESLNDDEFFQINQKINETVLSKVRELMVINAEPILSMQIDLCSTPYQINQNFLPPFADYQAPYHIPNGKLDGGKFFTQKIYNITLFGLSNVSLARVGFGSDRVVHIKEEQGKPDKDTDEALGTFVEFPVGGISGRMNFNDSSVKFNEMVLQRLEEMLVVNATSTGEISLFPSFGCNIAPVPFDPAFSLYDSLWIMEKLEDIIEHSMMSK